MITRRAPIGNPAADIVHCQQWVDTGSRLVTGNSRPIPEVPASNRRPEISHSPAASQTDGDIALDYRELPCFAVHCRLPLQTVMIEAPDEVSRVTNRIAITTDCRQLRSTRGSLRFPMLIACRLWCADFELWVQG
jgi:hypothetical protein